MAAFCLAAVLMATLELIVHLKRVRSMHIGYGQRLAAFAVRLTDWWLPSPSAEQMALRLAGFSGQDIMHLHGRVYLMMQEQHLLLKEVLHSTESLVSRWVICQSAALVANALVWYFFSTRNPLTEIVGVGCLLAIAAMLPRFIFGKLEAHYGLMKATGEDADVFNAWLACMRGRPPSSSFFPTAAALHFRQMESGEFLQDQLDATLFHDLRCHVQSAKRMWERLDDYSGIFILIGVAPGIAYLAFTLTRSIA